MIQELSHKERERRTKRRMLFSKPLLGTLFLVISCVAFAQGSFTASVDKKKVSVNGTLQITFTLTNADGKNFTPPSFGDFQVLSGPNQSTNMQFINGSMSRSVAFSYYL